MKKEEGKKQMKEMIGCGQANGHMMVSGTQRVTRFMIGGEKIRQLQALQILGLRMDKACKKNEENLSSRSMKDNRASTKST